MPVKLLIIIDDDTLGYYVKNLFETAGFEVSVTQSAGSYSTYSSGVSASYGKGLLRGQTRIYRENSLNDFTYKNTALLNAPREIQQNADYTRLGVLQEIFLRPSEEDMVAARIWIQQNDRGVPKLMTSFSFDEENRQQDQSIFGGVEWTHYGSILKWKVLSGVTNMDLDYRLSKITPLGDIHPVLSSQSNSWSITNQMDAEGRPLAWLTLGATIQNAWHTVVSNERIIGSGYQGTLQETSLRVSVAIEATKRLTLTGFMLQDVYDRSLSPFIPSLSVKYKLPSKHTLDIKGVIGKNYNRPSLNDLYWQPGGNPNLLPEEGTQWELGISYSTPSERAWFRADAHIYQSRVSNWIAWYPHLKGYWEPINIPGVDPQGGEVNATLGVSNSRLKAKVNGRYSNTQTTVVKSGGLLYPDSEGRQLPFIPVHSAGITADISYRDFYMIYSFTHFSERFTTTSNNPNSIRTLYSYFMNAVSIGKSISVRNIKSSLQIRVDNLLNENYQTILWRPMPGRNYTVMIRVDL